MKALVRTEHEVTFVELVGFVDIESVTYFRKYCQDKLGGLRVVVNLSQLNFVGSSGIFNFMDALKELGGTDGQTLRLCGGGPEFRRIFALGSFEGSYMFEDEQLAFRSFYEPQIFESAKSPAIMTLEPWEDGDVEIEAGTEAASGEEFLSQNPDFVPPSFVQPQVGFAEETIASSEQFTVKDSEGPTQVTSVDPQGGEIDHKQTYRLAAKD